MTTRTTLTPRELPALKPGSWIALDTETSGLFPDDGATVATVSVAWFAADQDDFCTVEPDQWGICGVAFPFDQGPQNKPDWNGQGSLFEQDDPNLGPGEWWELVEWIRRLELRLVMHNAQFDLVFMRTGVRAAAWGGALDAAPIGGVDLAPWTWWDTALGQRAYNPGDPVALKPALELYRGDTSDEQKVLKKYLGPKTDPRFDKVPWEIIEPYATTDATKTLWLGRMQWATLEGGQGGPQSWHDTDLEMAKLLVEMEIRGDIYDAVTSRQVARKVSAIMTDLAREIPFPKTDPGAKKFFEKESLTAEVLGDMVAAEGIDSLAGIWQRYKKLQTANKMWYSGYADKVGRDGRLRTRFKQMGTKTGRMSCERVNLQATPQDFRLEVPDLEGLPTPRGLQKAATPEGWARGEADLAQAELRVAVGVVVNRKMAKQIIGGLDAHGETAKALFRVDPSSPDWDFRRQLAKRSNFSLINGVGWETFRRTIHKETGEWLGEVETQVIVRKWNDLYPQHRREIQAAMKRAERVKYVPLANGRKRTFAAYEGFYKAHGNSVQGSIGFLTIDWVMACEAICRKWGVQERAREDGIGGAGVLSSVHDSVYLLLPAENAEKIMEECRQAALDLWTEYFDPYLNRGWSRIWVPGKVDIKIHYAKAKDNS